MTVEQLHRKQITNYHSNNRWLPTAIIPVSSGWSCHQQTSHWCLTHSYLLSGADQPECETDLSVLTHCPFRCLLSGGIIWNRCCI